MKMKKIGAGRGVGHARVQNFTMQTRRCDSKPFDKKLHWFQCINWSVSFEVVNQGNITRELGHTGGGEGTTYFWTNFQIKLP